MRSSGTDSEYSGLGQRKCARPHEESAQSHGSRIIDPQNGDGCSTDGRAPHQHRRLPAEMFAPVISTRMKKPHDFTRPRINAGQVGTFVTVTVDATQGEIVAVG